MFLKVIPQRSVRPRKSLFTQTNDAALFMVPERSFCSPVPAAGH